MELHQDQSLDSVAANQLPPLDIQSLPSIKVTRRIFFDVRGSIFCLSLETLSKHECRLTRLAESYLKNSDGKDDMIIIDKNPKYFRWITDILLEFDLPTSWTLPDTDEESYRFQQELQYYEISQGLQRTIKDQISQRKQSKESLLDLEKTIETLKAENKALEKKMQTEKKQLQEEYAYELKKLEDELEQEKLEHSQLKQSLLNAQLRTDGCYSSISEISFAFRIAKDYSRIEWSNCRSVVRQSSFAGYNTIKLKSSTEAPVVLTSPIKTCCLIERSIKEKDKMEFRLMDIISQGDNEAVILMDNSSPDNVPYCSKSYQRIVCKFIEDPKTTS